MQLTFDADVEAFRDEFIAFLDEHLPDEAETGQRSRSTADVPEWARRWQRVMFDHGWLLPGLAEFGGRNATIVQQYVHRDELSKRRIYQSFNPQGLGIIAASLLSFGTDAQKQRWAVPILRAEITAALGMSEPGAGSDLASLRTSAVRDGDHFVVNGQKVWTSGAHDADVILTFVRTDPNVPKHKGISVLLIPTDTPGGAPAVCVDLQPRRCRFQRSLLQRCPGARREVDRPARRGLEERPTVLSTMSARCCGSVMPDWLEQLINDFTPVTEIDRDRYATLVMDSMAAALGSTRCPARPAASRTSRPCRCSNCSAPERFRTAVGHALEAAGSDGLAHPASTSPFAPFGEDVIEHQLVRALRRSFGGTIAGGTSEIQRGIIAQRCWAYRAAEPRLFAETAVSALNPPGLRHSPQVSARSWSGTGATLGQPRYRAAGPQPHSGPAGEFP